MFKSAIVDGCVTVDNPSIWRPILDVRDTSSAFLRAVQADHSISGAFNVAYDNFTVGQIADMVKDEVEALSGKRVGIEINDIQDFRNYKVSCQKARTYLGFLPKYTITDIVENLYAHLDAYGDFSDDSFYNINTFKNLE